MLLFKQERVEKEINIRLHGIGLSLVNDRIHKEIAYMAISRSATIILSTVDCFCLFTCGAMYTYLLYLLIHVVLCTILSAGSGYALLKWFSNPVMRISIL